MPLRSVCVRHAFRKSVNAFKESVNAVKESVCAMPLKGLSMPFRNLSARRSLFLGPTLDTAPKDLLLFLQLPPLRLLWAMKD